MKQPNKRIALVTGGAQGIGFTIAQRLHAAGMQVVIADLHGAGEAAARLGAGADAFTLDVSDAANAEAMVTFAMERFGQVDVLVNNAGLFTTLRPQPFEDIQLDEWRRVFAVNVEGVWNCSRAVAGPMKQARSGSIVNIASATVAKGSANMLHYVASKGAVVAMTRSLARELGGFDIRVNTVSPGLTLSDGVLAEAYIGDVQQQAVRTARALHRDVTPDDIAAAVAYLADDGASMVTGQTLTVDGGMVMN